MWLCLLLHAVSATLYEGKTSANNNGFVFLGKFVFDTQIDGINPTFDVHLHVDPSVAALPGYQGWELLLFDDEDTSWPAIYDQDPPVSCSDARLKARNIPSVPYPVKFNPTTGDWDGKGQVHQVARPRYWFIVLANCAGTVPEVEYSAHLVNAARGAWSRELGTNVMGLNTMYLVIFLLFFPYVCIHFHGVRVLSKKLSYVHPLVKLFAGIIILQLLVILCNLSYWGSYWQYGHGLPGAKPIGEIGDIIARVGFMLVLILLAKGWTINPEPLTQKWLIIGTVLGFGFVFVLLLILKEVFTDPAATDVPGAIRWIIYILLMFWLGFAVWFAVCLKKSYSGEDNPMKKKLYRNIGIVFFPWFLTFPTVNFLAIWVAPHKKEVIVETTDVVFSFLGFLVLSFLLWPSRAEEFFNINTPDVQKSNVDSYEKL